IVRDSWKPAAITQAKRMPRQPACVPSRTEVPQLPLFPIGERQMKVTACLFLAIGSLTAQIPNPVSQQSAPVNTGQPMPIFRVTVVSRTTKAVNYHHRTGTTHID